MSLTPRLDLRQSQSLVMTPQLRQAIQLLTLTNVEVEAALAAEVERNPLLSFDGGSSDGRAAAPSGAASGEAFDFDRLEACETSLCEHLMAQARISVPPVDLDIARALIGAVEETGYLSTPLAEIAAAAGTDLARVEAVLAIVQTLDPAGVAARSLAECLALQARAADRYDPAMARLIDNLDLLARGDLRALRRICGVDEEDLADMIAELRAFDPKPGCRFAGERAPAAPLSADLFVTRSADGWTVELNAATLPRAIVDRRYHAHLCAGGGQSRAFAAECLAGANWILRALDQRAATILKVATEIVRHQEDFFAHGPERMKPLTHARIAGAVGVHETTVGRVAANKSLSCERGLFPLRYFFTAAVGAGEGGEGASAEAVKTRIRALILAEPANAVLSDDALVDLLAKEGHEVARRTVAKYREACGIGSSVQRRRQRALARTAA